MDKYAVMGNPIAHSKSPQIHQAFAKQTGEQLCYDALLVPADKFAEHVDAFIATGGKGLNVTVPFKLEAWKLAQVRSKRAERAGSVNTLMPGQDGKLYGDNTDGVGMVRDIAGNHDCKIESKRLLLLGAGGAVRGVLAPLLKELPAELVIANRTVAKAEQLANEFSDLGNVTSSDFASLAGQSFDAVINGTAASLQGELPPLPDGIITVNGWSYDMMYGADETPFNRWARGQGVAKRMDGLGMLVEQAAESFYIWRHVRPQTAEVIQQIREQMQGG